jgi:hypothetical protein
MILLVRAVWRAIMRGVRQIFAPRTVTAGPE